MIPQLIIIAGFPGVGKSTIACRLQKVLSKEQHIPTLLLDKDELTGTITPRLHQLLGLTENDRESELHKTAVRPLSHEILYNAAKCGLESGLTVIMDAPFEQYIQEPSWYPALVNRFGISPCVIWIEIPKQQEYEQLKVRNRSLDSWKIAHFDSYYQGRKSIRLQVPEEYLFRCGQDFDAVYQFLTSGTSGIRHLSVPE